MSSDGGGGPWSRESRVRHREPGSRQCSHRQAHSGHDHTRVNPCRGGLQSKQVSISIAPSGCFFGSEFCAGHFAGNLPVGFHGAFRSFRFGSLHSASPFCGGLETPVPAGARACRGGRKQGRATGTRARGIGGPRRGAEAGGGRGAGGAERATPEPEREERSQAGEGGDAAGGAPERRRHRRRPEPGRGPAQEDRPAEGRDCEAGRGTGELGAENERLRSTRETHAKARHADNC